MEIYKNVNIKDINTISGLSRFVFFSLFLVFYFMFINIHVMFILVSYIPYRLSCPVTISNQPKVQNSVI